MFLLSCFSPFILYFVFWANWTTLTGSPAWLASCIFSALACLLYHFGRADVTKYQALGGSNDRNLFICSGIVLALEVWNRGVSRVGSFESWERGLCARCLPLAWRRLSAPSVSSHLLPPSMSLCLNFLTLEGYQSHWITAHLSDLILTWLPL